MAKLRVSKISIRNILGIEEVEFEPGRLTIIKGPNGTGKTSILEAIRGALQGGNDATLLRNGADEGEVVLVLDDGSEIARKVSSGKSSVSVKHPQFGKSSRPQSILDSLINRLTLNPVEFLVSSAARQKEMLLQALPMTVTTDQLTMATGLSDLSAPDGKHALEVIDGHTKQIYDLRTGVNRSLRDKQATAKQLQESLPGDPPEGDWLTIAGRLERDISDFEHETSINLSVYDDDRRKELDAIDELALVTINDLQRTAEEKIERIRRQLDADIDVQRITREQSREEIIRYYLDRVEVYKLERQPGRDQLLAYKENARTMADQSIRSQSAKELLRQLTIDVGDLQNESSTFTKALSGLGELKDQLTSTLPIRGLEIRDGELCLDAINFSRWNESRRVTIAIELAKLSAGDLGLVVVDGLERLDGETFTAFANHLMHDETCQYVVTRVSDDTDLNISTY